MSKFEQLLRSSVRRVQDRWRVAFARVARLTGAAVAAYLLALQLGTDPRPVTAALTALLIVQVTLVGTVSDTLRRIASVLLGVAVAIAVSTVVGFTWWSLGAVVAASIVLGQAARLGPHLMEVPISAMLILAAGGAGVQAIDRVIETLIGAGAGLLVNLLFPPGLQTRDAGLAVERFAASIGRLLDRAARSLSSGKTLPDEMRSWLQEARALTSEFGTVDRIVADAGESRRLNPRALGTPNLTPNLRTGLDTLEVSTIALRAVFRSLADGMSDDDSPLGEDLSVAFAELMSDLARAVRSFGALVRAEVEAADQPHPSELAGLLDAVREARARVTELLLVDPRQSPGQWEAHGSLLAGVQRVLAELDVEEHLRRRNQRRREADALRSPAVVAAVHAAERLRSTTRRVVADPAVRLTPRGARRRPKDAE